MDRITALLLKALVLNLLGNKRRVACVICELFGLVHEQIQSPKQYQGAQADHLEAVMLRHKGF